MQSKPKTSHHHFFVRGWTECHTHSNNRCEPVLPGLLRNFETVWHLDQSLKKVRGGSFLACFALLDSAVFVVGVYGVGFLCNY